MIIKNVVLKYNEKDKSFRISIKDAEMKSNKCEKSISEFIDDFFNDKILYELKKQYL